ncbi:MAG: rRNA maturation RNase YbeY [Gammaproteobacteria bacterium]|nr:rRNA maturation RNase YbeY [Gammaproteobacteria bacterium]MDH3431162.1 rRNA maturation RNase YbeY [Gammaproteobacteria bacterium]
MTTLTVDVQVACDDPDLPAKTDIQTWIDAAVRQSGRSTGGDIEIAVRIVDAEEIRMLNRQYREQNKATNVLAFPAGEIEGLPDNAGRLLGDIVICASVVSAEAARQGKRQADHWGHILVHGTLHLLGFDHGTDAEAAEMEGLESKILASRKVADPYEPSC